MENKAADAGCQKGAHSRPVEIDTPAAGAFHNRGPRDDVRHARPPRRAQWPSYARRWIATSEAELLHARANRDPQVSTHPFCRDGSSCNVLLGVKPPSPRHGPRGRMRRRLSLTWTLNFDEAWKAASEAGDLIAAADGEAVAADYLAEAAVVLGNAGFVRGAWVVAPPRN